MSTRYTLAGISGNVELGKGGPRLKDGGGFLQARNNADGVFVRVQGASGTAADDFVTKTQLDAVGGAGTSIDANDNLTSNQSVNPPTVGSGSTDCVNLGDNSTIGTFVGDGTISGGTGNSITSNGDGSAIGGGESNTSDSAHGTIGGGRSNSMDASNRSTIGGGESNLIDPPSGSISHATIGGGQGNSIYGGAWAFIGGGNSNTVGSATTTLNGDYAFIGGGQSNRVQGFWSSIPGGRSNEVAPATGSSRIDYGWAGGRRAKTRHQGAFLWADSTDQDEVTDRANQSKTVATGGVTERTTAGFSGEHVERFNGHASTTTAGQTVDVVLGNLGTDQHTLNVDVVVHASRDTGDNFYARNWRVVATRTGGTVTINQLLPAIQRIQRGTGVNVSTSIVTNAGGDVILRVQNPSAANENWEWALRWTRQEGGFAA